MLFDKAVLLSAAAGTLVSASQFQARSEYEYDDESLELLARELEQMAEFDVMNYKRSAEPEYQYDSLDFLEARSPKLRLSSLRSKAKGLSSGGSGKKSRFRSAASGIGKDAARAGLSRMASGSSATGHEEYPQQPIGGQEGTMTPPSTPVGDDTPPPLGAGGEGPPGGFDGHPGAEGALPPPPSSRKGRIGAAMGRLAGGAFEGATGGASEALREGGSHLAGKAASRLMGRRGGDIAARSVESFDDDELLDLYTRDLEARDLEDATDAFMIYARNIWADEELGEEY